MRKILLALMILLCASNAFGAISSAVIVSSAVNTMHITHLKKTQFNLRKEGQDKVVIPCGVVWNTGFFKKGDNLVDIQRTHEECKKTKQMMEEFNNTKYKFGKATMYDDYYGKVYIELIEE